jgi:hypothetical protein
VSATVVKAGVRRCAFCDAPADTQEHVIPAWLQRHYKLSNQHLGLSNETSIRYKQAVIPACAKCNNDRLGPLEQRVQQSQASKQDYFLWALKITYGLSVRDATLPLNRTSPTSPPLVPQEQFAETAVLLREAIRTLDGTGFRLSPDPFGSVLFIESDSGDFALIDVPSPFRALAIGLPDRGHLVVLPGDRGVIGSLYEKHAFLGAALQLQVPGMSEQSLLAVKLFGLLVVRSHLAIPREIHVADDGMVASEVPAVLSTIDQSRETYRQIAGMVHLPEEFADDAYSKWAGPYSAGARLRWR